MTARSDGVAITFDAYNTLLDFSSGAEAALREILPPALHPRIRDVGEIMNRAVPRLLDQFVDRSRTDFSEFVTLSAIHRAGFEEVRDSLLPDLDVDAVTDRWNRYIGRVPLYADARAAVEWSAAHWPTAIVSDIDTWMLEENVRRLDLPVRAVVTSEGERTYKAMADCTMFQAAAQLLGVRTEEIIHVGDSSADVIGARRAGARVVWLNRSGIPAPERMPRPDAEVRTLADLPAVVETLVAGDS